MTLDDLKGSLTNAAWFSRLGGPAATTRDLFAEPDRWDWLPTSREQPDPVHGDGLLKLAADQDRDGVRRSAEMSAARVALRSIAAMPDRLDGLVSGPHDLTPAAQQGAVYAARMAAREIVVGRAGFWCRVMALYADGYWPCGLDPTGELIVY